MTKSNGGVERRTVLLAGGAAATTTVLSGCIVEQSSPEAASTGPAKSAGTQATQATPGATQPAAGEAPLAQVVDVPAGGGLVLKDQKTVLTRDLDGRVAAFSAVCTHQGCLVSSVSNGTINCTCHGSKFDAVSGEPVGGPAKKPLPAVAIERRDGAIFSA
jgi:Rieske Fe-S protein